MASLVTNTLKRSLSEPLLTGALLYILTRGPLHIRERLIRPFQTNLLATNGSARLNSLVRLLKILTAVGVVRRANQALNRLAWNNWTLGRSGAAFRFGPGKEELVLITGGSSGFGYEMVKGFSKVARVVVMDIQAFPAELARCEFFSLSVWKLSSHGI
jgi:all-trans-retinol dehydrogenase (NAD+)